MIRPVPRLVRPAALLLAAIVVSACVGSAGGTSPSTSPNPLDPAQAVFSVGWENGFVAPGAILGRLPMVVVYGDGRVISQGPRIAIFPGPLMPNIQVRTLSAEAPGRLIELARTSGLLRTVRYDFPGIADAPDTVLTIKLDGSTYRVAASALAEARDAGPGIAVDAATTQGRAALRGFIDTLTGLPDTAFVDASHAYAPTALRIYAGKPGLLEPSDLPLRQPLVDWPLADLATAGTAVANQNGMRCQVIEGADLAKVVPLLVNANALSTVVSSGAQYSLIVRPLLPDETGC